MWKAVLAAAILASGTARAEGEAPGGHTHYVLALSWQPAWCALEGDARDAERCARPAVGWTLHGLWPQNEDGWPSWCPTGRAGPSAGQIAAMGDVMGSDTLAGHQWRKHGTCPGLGGREYLELSRLAFERVRRPEILRRVPEPMRLPPAVVEAAFLEANPGMGADGVTITCRAGQILEARICLTRELEPRPCSGATARDCPLPDAGFEPLR